MGCTYSMVLVIVSAAEPHRALLGGGCVEEVEAAEEGDEGGVDEVEGAGEKPTPWAISRVVAARRATHAVRPRLRASSMGRSPAHSALASAPACSHYIMFMPCGLM